jgi:hypothetical protein
MELTLGGNTSLQTEGTVTIELPSYMVLLPKEELEEARAAKNKHKLCLAAGRHPSTGDIVFLLGDGSIREVTHTRIKGIPMGPVAPVEYGHGIAIENDPTKRSTFEIATTYAIDESQPIVNLGLTATKEGSRAAYVDE